MGRVLVVALACIVVMGGVSASARADLVVSGFTATANNADGSLDTQAGDHPFSATTAFHFSGADVKDVIVDLPPGFIGNPQAAPQCPVGQLTDQSHQCPSSTQVGVASIGLAGSIGSYPVYNLVPEAGHPAEFGLAIYGDSTPILVYGGVREYEPTLGDREYSVRISGLGIVQGGDVTSVSFSFWGVPADPAHDAQRYTGSAPGTPSGDAPLLPFLTNPTQCVLADGRANTPNTTLTADAWQAPGRFDADGSPAAGDPNWKVSSAASPAVTGCDALSFGPSFSFSPDDSQVGEPAGYTADLSVPQNTVADQFATPELRAATVALPAGVSVSPSAADGLVGCSDAQIALSSTALGGCPPASQIATATVTSPLLASPLQGAVYIGTPACGPCSDADAASGRMLRLFIQAQGSGVVVKIPGDVRADPSTGQLTASFPQNPQLPFSDLLLKFKGGPRAALANPQVCGSYITTTDLSPWSAPFTPDATPSSPPFSIDWDDAGGACPATLPFSPGFQAQTSTPLAGAFTPFSVTFSRSDQQQPLSQISLRTPPGLLGEISSVPLCGDQQAAVGACPQASQIGAVTVAAGPGSHPFYLGGQVYLTGPYKGAPYGLSVVVPAVAGPFNLGTVVVRAAIAVDIHTSVLTITSDPLPQIISGVPTRVQAVNVTVDHTAFMLNPTNCAGQTVDATIYSSQGASATSSTPFAVTGCTGLAFAPKFTASSAAKTSRANGASLDVKIGYTPGQANVKAVKVLLPKQLPSRLTTIQKACLDTVFNANPAACPITSLVGTARVLTPVLPVPLTGPAYLVSHGGAGFPDLVVVLQGDGVTIELTGTIFISSQGITSSTFASVPDVPINTFELKFPTGPYSILAANGNLCSKPLNMPTTITAQNGREIKQTTRIKVTGCPKPKKKKTKAKARKASHHAHTRSSR